MIASEIKRFGIKMAIAFAINNRSGAFSQRKKGISCKY